MIRKFISYYKPHKLIFFADMFCAAVVAGCALFYPTIAKNIINDYVPNQKFDLFVMWSAVLLIIYLVKAMMNYFICYYGHIMGIRMQADMRKDIFKRLQKLPFSFFDENKTGVIMSRIINDLMEVTELAHHGPEDLFISVVLLIGSFIILAQINLWLTLIVFMSLPLVVLFAILMKKRMTSTFLESRIKTGEVNANLENAISGIHVSRAFTGGEYEGKKFDFYNQSFVKAEIAAYKVMAQFNSGMTLFTDLLYVIVLAAGGVFFFVGKINVGEFTVFLLYINAFLDPIKRLIVFYEQFQKGMTGFKRFQQIMDENEEVEALNPKTLESVKGNIEFKDVTFSYESQGGENESQRNIFRNLSLKIDAGKTVALVGPSGGGKTTLCHLIPRFYEISAGEIDIDGVDIRDVSRISLRKNIGIVAQDVFLFTGTVKENIAYGNLDASDEEIVEAAKKANIHDYIMEMPKGYDTYVGERGVRLSGGQKQRISIARVFLKNPSILILDEATSALDNATEMMIQGALEKLSQGRTCIVVAHRLSTIKNADEIVVIDDSGIAERGTHEELLKAQGEYAQLYRYQFKEREH